MGDHLRLRLPGHLASLAPYLPGKPIEEVERELGLSNSIKLASNENPIGPSPKAVEAARRALAAVNRYPDGTGHALRSALAKKIGIPTSRIVLGNGSTELVELLARTFLCGEHGEAVISEGAFIMYRIAVRAANGRERLVPQTTDFRHDASAMAEAVGESTRLIFIANPNNPTGTYIRDDELIRLLEKVPREVLVVVDEAYHEYVLAPDYPVNVPRLASHPNLVLLRTFSKVYGLAGLRVGYAMAGDEVAAILDRVRSPFNTSSIAQAAALAALGDEEHVGRSRESNRAELAFLDNGLRRLGLAVVPSVANFILVQVGPRAEQLFERMLRRGVIVRPMRSFGFPEALRITVGTRAENEHCLEALSASLA